MQAVMGLFTSLKATLGFSGPRLQRVQQDLAKQHAETGDLIGHLQARAAALKSTSGSLAVFWGRSYVGLRDVFESGCDEHLSELEQLRAHLDLATKSTARLRGRELRAAQAHATALWSEACELRREIAEREEFWRAEAAWALNMLGDRKPTSWPPEPLREMARAA